MSRLLALLLPALVAAAACGPPPPEERLHLVDHEAWELVEGDNPWAGEDEAGLGCDPTGYAVEPPLFEVETGLCDHAAFRQTATQSLTAGWLLHVVGWHLPLWSLDGGATGHFEVRVGDRVALDYRTDIPAGEAALSEYVELDEPVEEGTPIWFHVHNHGDNSWRLLEVSGGPEDVFGDVP